MSPNHKDRSMSHEWKPGDRALLEVEIRKDQPYHTGDIGVWLPSVPLGRWAGEVDPNKITVVDDRPFCALYEGEDGIICGFVHKDSMLTVGVEGNGEVRGIVHAKREDARVFPPHMRPVFAKAANAYHWKLVPVDPPAPAPEEERLTAEEKIVFAAASRIADLIDSPSTYSCEMRDACLAVRDAVAAEREARRS